MPAGADPFHGDHPQVAQSIGWAGEPRPSSSRIVGRPGGVDRYTGWGPTPLIVVDIYRVENGKIAEHRDVGQDEVLETASGLPMFEPMQ